MRHSRIIAYGEKRGTFQPVISPPYLKNISPEEVIMEGKLRLIVNEIPIETDHFVERFIGHTVSGMIESLEGAGKIKDLSLAIDLDNVAIELNGKKLPTNIFASRIIKSTVAGMLAPLKGVSDVKTVTVIINQ
jgi:hypothetical protein